MSDSIRKKLRNSLIVLGSVFVTLFIAVNIIISIQDISELKQAVPQPTLIYDANNEVATKLASSKTEGVKRKDIPDIMVQAIVAVEDKEFFNHHGIYYSGIISAVFQKYYSRRSCSRGKYNNTTTCEKCISDTRPHILPKNKGIFLNEKNRAHVYER